MQLNGFGQGMAHIDLSGGSVEIRPAPEDWVRKYIGGRGLGVRYVLENGPEVDPLSPENLLCFMNGPLTGSEANMSGRWACVTKSPLTGTVTDSHQGGWSGARLRWAGFDGLIFEGRAERPVYAFVEDGQVELRDASEVWGKGVHETVAFFRERYGEKDLSVCAIGPAGENRRSLRGLGQRGRPRLRARRHRRRRRQQEAQGDRDPRAPEQEPGARRGALEAGAQAGARHDPRREEHHEPQEGRALGLRHQRADERRQQHRRPAERATASETSFGERAEKITGEYVKEHILVDDPTCHACPVACKKEVEIKEGPYAGLRMESVEYEPAWSLGANCDNDDIGSIAKMIDQCNDSASTRSSSATSSRSTWRRREKGWVAGRGARLGRRRGHGRADRERSRCARAIGDLLAEGPARAARAPRPPGDRHGGEGPGHPRLRPARPEGHGPRLRHQQPRRLPPARLRGRRRARAASHRRRTRSSGRARASW